MPKKSESSKRKVEVVGFLGVGLDSQDGHQRITKGENFLLVGGSEVTHERMQDSAIHVNEKLRQRGKRLQDASTDELIDLFRESHE